MTFKKITAVCMSLILVFSFLCLPVNAEDGKTVFCLDYGNVTIGDDTISGYDENGNDIWDANPLGYVITQKNPAKSLDRSIAISSGTQNVELRNVNIKRKSDNGYAFAVLKTAQANITLTGENTLISGMYRAGLDIAYTASAAIEGDGSLYAESSLQAGIGGGNGKSNGTLTINSGTIYAVGGIDGYSAGIGGGTSGKGGTITINGGTVTAIGGTYAAGIGGGNLCTGGTITINGGTVTAVGGAGGAGIGGGYIGDGGTVVINGGSVKAVAGVYAQNIGNGYKCSTEFAGVFNSDGSPVSLTTAEITDFSEVFVDGIDTLPITAPHPDGTNLYLYSDGTEKIITVYNTDDTVSFYEFDTALTEIFPYADSSERFADRLIYSDEISANDGYEITDNSLLFSGETCIDSFTPALRGDMDFDGKLDAMDAVIADCAVSGMITDGIFLRIADVNNDKITDENDVCVLENCGLYI